MIIVCKKCLMPSSRPRVAFSNDEICNACLNSVEKRNVDWQARRREFEELIKTHRSKSGHYDCIVPWSGGKDSSTIAYRLKYEFGLNPLLVTFSPLIPTETGEHNREALRQAGFDHLMIRPNQRVARHLARRFFIERGNPKAAWDAGVTSTPVQVAVRYGIPLIFYAEHGESEYGGRVLSEEHKKMRDFAECMEHLIGDDPQNWMDDVVEERDLAPYLLPDPAEIDQASVKILYFGYFFRWSIYENFDFIKDKIDFRTAPSGRTDGTFTNYDSLDDKIDDLYYYMQYIKFGFGRALRDAARLIQNGLLDREKALEYVKQYDHEFPKTYIHDVLEYLKMTPGEFAEVVDLHRNSEIWKKAGNDWQLQFEIA